MRELYVSLFIIILCSCSPTYYYQTYNVSSENIKINESNEYVYEDDNCIVYYNFWSNGGNSGFKIFNKTNSDITIKKEACFFIYNGYANNYYKKRVYTNSTSSGVALAKNIGISKAFTGINYSNNLQTNSASVSNAASVSSSKGFSVSREEEKEIIIPPKASKYISEYELVDLPKKHCNLAKYPAIKNVEVVYFDIKNSPIKFNNRIVYEINEKVVEFENQFFVSQMSNIPKSVMVGYKVKTDCGKTASEWDEPEPYFIIGNKPDMFYIEYKNSETQQFGNVINEYPNPIDVFEAKVNNDIIISNDKNLSNEDTKGYIQTTPLDRYKIDDKVIINLSGKFYKATVYKKHSFSEIKVHKIFEKIDGKWEQKTPTTVKTIPTEYITHLKVTP